MGNANSAPSPKEKECSEPTNQMEPEREEDEIAPPPPMETDSQGRTPRIGCRFEPLKGEENSSSNVRNNLKRRNNQKPHGFTSSTSSNTSDESIESVAIPSLHGSLLRVHEQRDPLRFYEVIKVLGDGSMGSVSKVRKRQSAVGGSARKTFVQREKLHYCCFGLFDPENCGFLPKKSPSSKDLFEETPTSSSNADPITERSETKVKFSLPGTGLFSKPTPDRAARIQKYATAKSSSLISYEHKDATFALKSIHLDRCKDNVFRKELLNEIAILQSLDHPHIVKAMESFDYRNRLYLVLELCSGGDLYARDPYTEPQASTIIHSILDAIAYMHSKGITHRDLKFENIMFASPNSTTVKVIDFGLSKKYSQQEHLHDTVGTVYTMAPEVLKGDYDNKCDVWSMGIIAFMLLSSSLPFYGKTRQHVVRKIVNGKYDFKGHRWKQVSHVAKEFVMECLVRRASHRKSADQMLEHAFIKRDQVAESANIDFALMDRVQATIQTFCEYQRLKKLALLVVAHKSTEEEIGFLRRVFNTFDSVHDGEISLPEFKEALAIYHYDEEDLERMFVGMDLDGTGKVHYSEFLAATIEAHGTISEERIADAFDRLDSDDSGYITVKNILDFLGNSISEEFANLIIDEADTTNNHRISYSQFLALWNEKSDSQFQMALKSVNMRRVSSESSMEDFESYTTDGSVASSEGGHSANSSDLGGGNFFFGVEKEKSVRGVWV